MRLSRSLLCVVCVSGCSLTTSLGGFSNGDDDPKGDAALNAETGIDGAANDAPASDGGANDGAASDGAASDGSAGPFCASLTNKPTYCVDFDDGLLPPAGWSKNLNGATLDLTPTSKSAPNGLRSAFAPGTQIRSAYIAIEPEGTIGHMRLGYSLYVEERPDTGEFEVNIFRLYKDGLLFDYYLEISKTGAQYIEQKITVNPMNVVGSPVPLSKPIPTGKWTRVSLEVKYTQPAEIIVTIDGAEAARKTPAYGEPAPAQLNVGITYANAGCDKGKVVLDDVVFETLP